MTIPTKYPPSQEAAIASFDFTDLTSGLGYEDFFLAVSKIAGTNGYVLLANQLLSAEGEIQMTAEFNWDSSVFNLPRTVKGIAYISGTIEKASGQDANLNFRIIRILSDGSTESELASAVTLNRSEADTVAQPFLLEISLTETIIKKGEKLRLEIIPSVSSSQVYIGTSPTDQDGTIITPSSDPAATTITKVSIPFKIDI